jgi:rod shape-determining protein MreC
MQKLVYFIRRTYVAIIFVVLEIVAIRYYAYSTPYTQARLLAGSNYAVRYIHNTFHGVKQYFSLRSENIRLTERIAELENRLDAVGEYEAAMQEQMGMNAGHRYEYQPARVVANSINRPQNYITIDKGFNQGVAINMAVLSPEGYAVGTIVNCSENFSIARSLLNTSFRVSARLAEDGSIGSVHWNGGDSQVADFDDVTKYAHITEGDVVVAAGLSHYFPSGVIIGKIERATLRENATSYNCRIRLAADMSRLSNVLLVKNNAAIEAQTLEEHPQPAADENKQ